MDYTLIRSNRRTMAIVVTRDAELVVRAPRLLPQKDIDAFVESRHEWIRQTMAHQKELLAKHPPLTGEALDALRQRAKAYIPGRVSYWAGIMGLQPTAVKITSARSRFGSCSGKNTLCFSLYLMQYPSEAIDAVVVHELCHMRQHNHSPAFYAEMARWLPDYKEREKLLNI